MAQLLLANPRKRRAKRAVAKRKTPTRRRTVSAVTTTKVTRRRYKRNPSPRLMQQVQGAAVGAAGALAVDVLMAKLPMIPANMKSGVMGSAMQGIISIGLGMAASKFGNKKLGAQLADGGLTVALHGAMKSAAAPALGLNGFSDNGLLGFDSGLLGFQTLDDDGMGFMNPAPVSDGFDGYQVYSSDNDDDF